MRLPLLFAVLCVAFIPVAAQPPISNTEQWVLGKVAAGEYADLTQWSADEENRVVSSLFLRRLLTKNLPAAKVPAFGVRISSAVVTGNLDLTHENIPYYVSLNHCRFEGDVSLVVAHFQSSLHFDWSTFENLADFRFVVIDGDLEARGANFTNKDLTANFEGMKVSGPVLLKAAHFYGPARFYGATITNQLWAPNSNFHEGADFEGINVTGPAVFTEGTRFDGPVRFYKATIGGNLELEGAKFDVHNADFEGAEVKGYLFLRGATFMGSVSFYRATITNNLVASNAKFLSPNTWVNFESMVVKGHAFYHGAIFSGPVGFLDTVVEGKFELDGAEFNSTTPGISFDRVKAEGIGFAGTVFKGPVSVNGMSYQRITTGSPRDVLAMIERAKYDIGAYSELEKYYRSQGNATEADSIYIRQRSRQRQELSFGPRWLWNWLLDRSTRYGRQPERVIFWGALVVSIGVLIFRKRFMEAQRSEFDSRPYSPFLYSLDLFLPIVDLHAANVWMPKGRYSWVRRYLPLHVILGWLLVTIFIGALSGLLK